MDMTLKFMYLFLMISDSESTLTTEECLEFQVSLQLVRGMSVKKF
jgi:hypothetical protein